LSNEEKTNDYEDFEKGMIYMEILKKGGVGLVACRYDNVTLSPLLLPARVTNLSHLT
jgi:hypothetical protein